MEEQCPAADREEAFRKVKDFVRQLIEVAKRGKSRYLEAENG